MFYRFGPFLVDATSRTVHLGTNKQALPEKVFQILVVLLEAEGGFVSRERFFDVIWPDDIAPSDANLSQHVFLLRRILVQCGGTKEYILTASGRGYRIGVAVERKIGLTMKASCEYCRQPLARDGEAYICSYECTFCRNCCTELSHECPNCGGPLVVRPPRKVNAFRSSSEPARLGSV